MRDFLEARLARLEEISERQTASILEALSSTRGPGIGAAEAKGSRARLPTLSPRGDGLETSAAEDRTHTVSCTHTVSSNLGELEAASVSRSPRSSPLPCSRQRPACPNFKESSRAKRDEQDAHCTLENGVSEQGREVTSTLRSEEISGRASTTPGGVLYFATNAPAVGDPSQSRLAQLKESAWLSYAPTLQWLLDKLSPAKEPERHGIVNGIVTSPVFSALCQLVILLNGVFVFFSTNYHMEHLDQINAPYTTAAEIFFAAFYTVELALKLCNHGRFFFMGAEAAWNWFDSMLVLVTLLDLMGSLVSNVGFARSLRVLKAVKVLRVVRVLQFASELRLMINCVLGSLVSLFWCVVMICFVMFLFAVYFTQAVGQHLKDVGQQDVSLQDFPEFRHAFGNVQTTILTLFKSVTGGADWQETYGVLLPVGATPCACFLAYVFVFLFSIWNVIMSVFVEKALKLAQPDADDIMLERRRKEITDAKELRALFERADVDSSSTLTQEEFTRFMSQPEFQTFLQARGIDIKEAHTFFDMIADSMYGSDVEVGTIVGCCLRIKGLATSLDLHTLRYEVRGVALRLEQIAKIAEKIVGMGSLTASSVAKPTSFSSFAP